MVYLQHKDEISDGDNFPKGGKRMAKFVRTISTQLSEKSDKISKIQVLEDGLRGVSQRKGFRGGYSRVPIKYTSLAIDL